MPKQQPPATTADTLPVPIQVIERRIHVIRGQTVMLDADLAELYQVPTKVLNQAVFYLAGQGGVSDQGGGQC